MIRTTKFTDEDGNKKKKDEFFDDNGIKTGEVISGDFDTMDMTESTVKESKVPDNQEILSRILLNQATIISELQKYGGIQ